MDYFEQVRPTYIENWSPALASLSVAQVDVPLSKQDAISLGCSITDWGEVFRQRYPAGPFSGYERFQARFDEAVSRLPDGCFVRLGGCSPKDSWLGHREGFRCLSGKKAFLLLTDASERVYEDLMLTLHNNYLPHVWFRRWQDIAKHLEFRCFVRNQTLIAISQYNYHDAFAVDVDKHTVEWAVLRWLPSFYNACSLQDVVADVFVTCQTHDNERRWQVKLIEINPLFEMTDPCLFSWPELLSAKCWLGFRTVKEQQCTNQNQQSS